MTVLEELNFQSKFIWEVFDSMKSSTAWYDKSKLSRRGEAIHPFVSRSRASNGIDGFCSVQDKAPEPANALTIGLDTQTVAYQPVAFYTSQNIQVLRDRRLNERTGLVLAAVIKEQMGKFSWGGNGATLGRLKRTRIFVPVTTSETGETVVNWDGLERLGIELHQQILIKTRRALQAETHGGDELPPLRFGAVDVMKTSQHDGIFLAHKGKRLIAADRTHGKMPFVGAARTNNSIVSFSDTEALFPGGWVTLIYNGDGGTGHAKYQPMPFNASDDVIALEPVSDKASEEALLMLVTALTQQCVSKFSFGYKLKLERLRTQKIMVPVKRDDEGNDVVDWEGMTAYGRALRIRAERELELVQEGALELTLG